MAIEEPSYEVQFVLPKGITLATAPEPVDPRVQLREVPGGRAAVIVTAARNGSTIFVRADRRGAWRAVSAPVYPQSGSGLVTVRTGWANGTFLHIR